MNNINVCLSCDDKYSKYAGVVIASILSNAKTSDSLAFYVLDGGISNAKKEQILSLKSIKDCKIEFIKINPSDFDEYQKVCTHKYITIATYYRLKLATLLPEISKIIYFDCDMVVNSSLEELFNVNLDNYLVAGVHDIDKKTVQKNPNYVNAGMLVFNLDLIRKENIEEKFLKYTKENLSTITCGDQTIINEVCIEKIKVLDDTWNVQTSDFMNRSNYTNKPKVIHYIAKNKPWCRASLCYFKNCYLKYLQLTPWKKSAFEVFQYKYIEQPFTLLKFVLHRPTFAFQKKFYRAIFETYFKKKD